MLSSRPYLAKGLYEWLLDNEHTPYIVVDAEQDGVRVPRQFVQNGQIVLNVAPTAVRDLHIENHGISFHARFGGQPMQVIVPMPALVAIYARENGVGMVFGNEPVMPAPQADDPARTSSRPELSAIDSQDDEQKGESSRSGQEKGTSSKQRPSLRVIK